MQVTTATEGCYCCAPLPLSQPKEATTWNLAAPSYSVMLLAHDDDLGAETFCAWGKVVQTIFSRLWSAQQRRGCCAGGAHQEGRIPVAATAVNALNHPLPS